MKLKTNVIKYKDPNTNQYVSIPAIVSGGNASGNTDDDKQDKIDYNLNTESKEIVGAINELSHEIVDLNNTVFIEDNEGWALLKGYIGVDGEIVQTPSKNTDYVRATAISVYGGSHIDVLNDNTALIYAEYTDSDTVIKRIKQEGKGSIYVSGKSNIKFSIYDKDNKEYTDAKDALSNIELHLKTNTIKEDVNTIKEDVNDLKKKTSVFDKSSTIDFGAITTGYYEGMDTYSDGFGRTTQYNEVLSKFDTLMDSNGYMTKKVIGKSSRWNYDIVQYDFTPISLDYDNGKKLPKVLIVSAHHGMEKASVYGLYYFIKDLMTKYNENEVLSYIRNNVVLKIIPILNPSGFNINGYVNGNGVNINRNYGTSGFTSSQSAEVGNNQYGGVEPFDQEETKCVRDLIQNNLDALVYIDYHTNGSSSITKFEQVNWHDYPITENTKNDNYYKKFIEIGCGHIRNITGHFISEFNLNTEGKPCGEITQASGEGFPSSDTYACDNGILGLTFEGFAGFQNEEVYTERIMKANSELICNYILSVINGLRS